MSKSRRGPAPPPGVAVPIRTECCPEDGKANVRFLGRYFGTFTHYSKKGSTPCLGESECPSPLHKNRMIWKGFAPAEYYRREPYNDWCPCVWEVTESLDHILAGISLRGTVWEIFRVPGDCGKPEVTALLLSVVHDEKSLRPAFDVKPCVARLYGYLPMQWDVKNHVPPRLRLEPSQDAPPPGVEVFDAKKQVNGDTRSPEERARIRAMLDEGKRRIFGHASKETTPEVKPHTNGKEVHS